MRRLWPNGGAVAPNKIKPAVLEAALVWKFTQEVLIFDGN